MNAIICLFRCWLRLVFDKVDKISFLYFNQLIVSIEEGEYKMEKV